MRFFSSISASLLLIFISAVVCDDASCLSGLKSSLEQGERGQKLSQWTPSILARPCNNTSTSENAGITCSNNRVVSIALSFCDLSGTLSPSIADCTNLQTLDLSSNFLSGPIPSSVGNLTNLVSLNLSANILSGPIPLEISTCQYLNFLDLHSNQLSGPIPGQLGLLQKLRFLDISNNKLSGQVPTNLGPHFNASSFVGNKDLFGYPLPPPSSQSLTVLEIVGIGLGSGLFSLIVSSMAVCIWLRVSEQGYAAREGKISQLVSES